MNIDDLLVQFMETLDRELELLATVRYRLIVLGALAGGDHNQSIPTAVHEAEIAFEALRLSELVRASVTVRLADEFNLDATPRIEELASHATGSWSELLLERRKALIESVAEIQGLASSITETVGRRAALTEETLRFLHGDAKKVTYGRANSRGGVLVEGAI